MPVTTPSNPRSPRKADGGKASAAPTGAPKAPAPKATPPAPKSAPPAPKAAPPAASTPAPGPKPSVAAKPIVAANPARKARADSAASAGGARMIDPEARRALIAQAAYFRAESRGFAPGHEAEDWLAAEVEVDTALTVSAPGNPAIQ